MKSLAALVARSVLVKVSGPKVENPHPQPHGRGYGCRYGAQNLRVIMQIWLICKNWSLENFSLELQTWTLCLTCDDVKLNLQLCCCALLTTSAVVHNIDQMKRSKLTSVSCQNTTVGISRPHHNTHARQLQTPLSNTNSRHTHTKATTLLFITTQMIDSHGSLGDCRWSQVGQHSACFFW